MAGGAEAAATASDGGVGFEATFGRLETDWSARKNGGLARSAAAPGAEGSGGGDWRAVFDMPSHALPSLAALCPAFLDSLLRREAAEAPRRESGGAEECLE